MRAVTFVIRFSHDDAIDEAIVVSKFDRKCVLRKCVNEQRRVFIIISRVEAVVVMKFDIEGV